MVQMVPLVTLGDRFEARVLVARLGADGIICRLQGEVDSPYPLGPVVVLVERDHLDEASALLLLDELEVSLDGDRASAHSDRAVNWALVAAPVAAGVFMILRMVWI